MDDWSEVWDEGSQTKYYFNSVTGESAWTPPEGWVDDAVEEAPVDAPPSSSVWTEVFDEGSEQTYYFNTVTGESQWTKPEEMEDPAEEVAPPESEHIEEVTLPPDEDPANWEEIFEETYQTHYYVNHVTQETQWEKPACMEEGAAATLDLSVDAAAAGGDGGEGEEKGGEFSLLDDGNGSPNEGGSAIVGMLFSKLGAPEDRTDSADDDGEGDKHQQQPSVTYLDMEEQTIQNIGSALPPVNVMTLKTDAPLGDFLELLKEITFEQFAAKHFNIDPTATETDVLGASSGVGPASFIKRNSRRQSSPFVSGSAEGGMVTSGGSSSGNQVTNSQVSAIKAPAPVSWKEEPISISLCVMSDAESAESAIKINRLILGYMGDRKTKKGPAELLKLILEECMRGKGNGKGKGKGNKDKAVAAGGANVDAMGAGSRTEGSVQSHVESHVEQLRDEVFCQIMRQLRHNPSINSEEKGWHLFLACLATFPPSMYLTPYLMSHFLSVLSVSADISNTGGYQSYEAQLDASAGAETSGADALQVEISRKKGEIKRLAELCLRTVLKSLRSKTAVRSHYPTPSEISHLKSGRDMDAKVHLPDGECIAMKVDSWTTVGELFGRVGDQMGVTTPNLKIFALYEVSNGGEEHALDADDRVVDIISFHYFDSARGIAAATAEDGVFTSFKFVFKARLFFDCTAAGALTADEDNSTTRLLYAQAVHDVIAGKYPLLKSEATVLAGIQAQEMFGNYLDDKALKTDGVDAARGGSTPHSAYDSTSLTKFLSREYIGNFENSQRDELREDVLRCYLKLHGLSGVEAQRSYLTLLRGCKLYGAAYYVAENVNGLAARGMTEGQVILAITCQALVVVDPVGKKFLLEYHMANMKSWGYNANTMVIEINSKHTDGAIADVEEDSDDENAPPTVRGQAAVAAEGKLIRLMFTTSTPKVIADLLRDYNCPERNSMFG